MAAFIAKQMVGDQLKSVKGAIGDKDKEEGEGGEAAAEQEEDPEIAEARREAEEKRKEKHRKMEEERESMRQTIRDKYGIKKREVIKEKEEEEDASGRIGRKKKTPAELAAEANADSDDESQNSFIPKDFNELSAKVSELPGKVASSVSEATEKCVLQ